MSKARRIAVECDWNSKSSRNVQSWKVSFFNKKQMRLSRKILIFLESLKVAILPENATGIAWIFKTFKVEILGFLFKKKIGLSKKIMNFLQIAEGCKFAGECDWNCNISQNVQNLGFFQKKDGFSKKKSWGF